MKNNFFSKFKNNKLIQTVLVLILVVLIAAGAFFYEKMQGRVAIENSLVSAPIINIAPQTSGKLVDLNVHEGDKVKKGDPLAIVGSQTLYADNDGMIIMANKQIGGLISASNPVIQLINTNDLRIAGTIDENKGLNKLKIGQPVYFTVDALPDKTFWGYIDEISPSAKQTQLSFSISSERPTQQFVVYARFDSAKNLEIKNGMSAKMTVYTNIP